MKTGGTCMKGRLKQAYLNKIVTSLGIKKRTATRCWVARDFTVCRTHTRTSIIFPHALAHPTSIFDDRTSTRTFRKLSTFTALKASAFQ